MILTGSKIFDEIAKGNIFISDFDKERLGPNSYNLRLAPELITYTEIVLDAKENNRYEEIVMSEEGFVLQPGKLYLARTAEFTKTKGFVPMLEGRSSVGRLGVSIHVTAGFGDIGFEGYWTLELYCVEPVRIYPGMEICQIYYLEPVGRIEKEYNGKYQGSTSVVSSRMFEDKYWRDK